MFNLRNNKKLLGKSNESFETIIGESLRIEGNLNISQSVRLDGQLNGNVLQVDGKQTTVAISQSATVVGDIRAEYVIVAGKVIGNIFTNNRVELLETAEVIGDINYAFLGMEIGAKIKGNVNEINGFGTVDSTASHVISQVKLKSIKIG
jgi:cytoskeletal protein CcmA (bactofilin family)